MRKTFVIALLMSVLASCQLGKRQKEIMDSWLGHGRKELIMSWGPPTRVTGDGNTGNILIYATQQKHFQVQPTTQPPSYYWRYKMFYINDKDKIYHWLIKNENIAPHQINMSVYYR